MVYAELEPFGAIRDNLHAGIIAATLCNIHRDKKRRPQPYAADDFVLRDQETDRRRTTFTTLKALEALAVPQDDGSGETRRST